MIDKNDIYNEFLTVPMVREKSARKLIENGYLFHEVTEDKADKNEGIYFTSSPEKVALFDGEPMILDSENMNVINIKEKISDNNIFPAMKDDLSALRMELIKLEYEYSTKKSELVNNRIAALKKNIARSEKMKPIQSKMSILAELIHVNQSMTYKELNNKLKEQGLSDKDIFEIYKFIGYDGFKEDENYIFFALKKVSNNIVNNKETLISLSI